VVWIRRRSVADMETLLAYLPSLRNFRDHQVSTAQRLLGTTTRKKSIKSSMVWIINVPFSELVWSIGIPSANWLFRMLTFFGMMEEWSHLPQPNWSEMENDHAWRRGDARGNLKEKYWVDSEERIRLLLPESYDWYGQSANHERR